jgi:uncharacterized repeat protein (TIGR04052 family)
MEPTLVDASTLASRRLRPTLGLLAAAALLTACGGGGNDGPQAVEIRFATVAGGTPVNCSTASIPSLGSTNATGRLKDARFYIMNVSLVRADGSEEPLRLPVNDNWNATNGNERVTLIDLEDKTGACDGTTETNPSVKGTVPAGIYVGVKMTMGVPFVLNHTNQGAGLEVTPAVVNNAVNPGMAWAWAGGRKFAKIEVTDTLASSPAGTAGKWTAPVFNVHIGSTGCTGTNPAAGQVDRCSGPQPHGGELRRVRPRDAAGQCRRTGNAGRQRRHDERVEPHRLHVGGHGLRVPRGLQRVASRLQRRRRPAGAAYTDGQGG